MDVTNEIGLDPFDRHLPAPSSSQILRHAGVSPEALGAQSLVNNDASPDAHRDINDIDADQPAACEHGDRDDRSISPTTTGNPYHNSCHQSLFIPLFHLQLDVQFALFATRNRVLSL
jgi:hypothetical protein